jgi:hypothetical protein
VKVPFLPIKGRNGKINGYRVAIFDDFIFFSAAFAPLTLPNLP